MNIHEKFMDETIHAIWNITRYKYTSPITVKKIRDFYDIKSKDSSKIHFYWRCLRTLEQNGILKRYGSNKPYKYQVSNHFKFFELFYDANIRNHSSNVRSKEMIPI